MVRGGITRKSKTKVIVARSTRVHIRVMMRRAYIREYGIIIVHIMIHGIMKVNGFVICRVISHCMARRLDKKGRRGRREGSRIRTGGTIIGVIRLMRWMGRYIMTTKEGMILKIGGRRGGRLRVRMRVGVRMGVIYTLK